MPDETNYVPFYKKPLGATLLTSIVAVTGFGFDTATQYLELESKKIDNLEKLEKVRYATLNRVMSEKKETERLVALRFESLTAPTQDIKDWAQNELALVDRVVKFTNQVHQLESKVAQLRIDLDATNKTQAQALKKKEADLEDLQRQKTEARAVAGFDMSRKLFMVSVNFEPSVELGKAFVKSKALAKKLPEFITPSCTGSACIAYFETRQNEITIESESSIDPESVKYVAFYYGNFQEALEIKEDEQKLDNLLASNKGMFAITDVPICVSVTSKSITCQMPTKNHAAEWSHIVNEQTNPTKKEGE